MGKNKYITYGFDGRATYHKSLISAIKIAKRNRGFVDITKGSGTTSIRDYRNYNKGTSILKKFFSR
jgi:hypothetical protein